MSEQITNDGAYKSAMTLEKIVPKALEGQSSSMNLLGFMLDGSANNKQTWNDVSKQLTHDLPVAGLQSFTTVNDAQGNVRAIDFANGNAKLSCAQDGIGWNCSWNDHTELKF